MYQVRSNVHECMFKLALRYPKPQLQLRLLHPNSSVA